MIGANGVGGRRCARIGLGGAALALLAVGCTPSEPSDEGGASETAPVESTPAESTPAAANEPTNGDIPVPTVWVLSTPPGFEDVMPEALTDQWADIVTGSACVLAGRAGAQTDAVEDMRAASVGRLEQIAAESGASLGEVTDIDLTTQGAGEGNDPHHALTLVMANWSSSDDAVRGLSRVGNLVLYDGSLVSQWLDLTFSCAGEVDEQAWTAVTDDLRPVMQFTGGEGWDGLSPDSF